VSFRSFREGAILEVAVSGLFQEVLPKCNTALLGAALGADATVSPAQLSNAEFMSSGTIGITVTLPRTIVQLSDWAPCVPSASLCYDMLMVG
jgi:hypothetical protein